MNELARNKTTLAMNPDSSLPGSHRPRKTRQRPTCGHATCGHASVHKRRLVATAAILIVLLTADSVWACPNCKDNLSGDSATAFAASILFMMSMPFAIFGGWIVAILRLRRRIRSDG